MLKIVLTYSSMNFAIQQNHVPVIRKLCLKNERNKAINEFKAYALLDLHRRILHATRHLLGNHPGYNKRQK